MASVRALNIGLVNCKVNQNETLNVSGTLNVESSITVSNGFTNSMNTVNTKGGDCFIHTTVLDGAFNSSDEAGRAIAYIPNEYPFYDKDNFLYDSDTKQALALYNMIDTYFDFRIGRVVVDQLISVDVVHVTYDGDASGRYFYFYSSEWEEQFGYINDSYAMPYIYQIRGGGVERQGVVRISPIGGAGAPQGLRIGKWNINDSDEDWQIGDKIALQIFLPDVSGRNTDGVVVNRKASIDTYLEYASLSESALAYSASKEAYLFNNVLKMDAYGFGGDCAVAVMIKLDSNQWPQPVEDLLAIPRVEAQYPCIFWFMGTNTNGQYRCVLDIIYTNVLRVVIKEGVTTRMTKWENDPLTVDVWYHIVLVNTTSEIKLYINGSLRTPSITGGLSGLPYVDFGDSSVFTSSDTNPAFWIGGASGQNRRLLQSYIKYFAIFNEVLDETQIIKLWNLWFGAEVVSVDLGTYDSYSITTNDTAKLEFTSSRAAKGFIEEIENPPGESRSYSTTGGSHPENHQRSWLDSPQAWSAGDEDDDHYPYMTIDLGSTKTVIGVITQGRNPDGPEEWVTEYQITSSEDNLTFYDVDGGTKFVGNRDASTKVSNYFYASVRARYIRFHPNKLLAHNYTSMRAGVITSVWKTIIQLGQVQNSTIYSSPELDVPKICNFDLSGCRVDNGERLSFRTSEGWGESYIYGVDSEEKAQLHNFDMYSCRLNDYLFVQTNGGSYSVSYLEGGSTSDYTMAKMARFNLHECRLNDYLFVQTDGGSYSVSYLQGGSTSDYTMAKMYKFDLYQCRIANGDDVFSDDRAKHNEVDISNCLATLNKLKPKFYIKTEIMDSSGNEYPRDHNFDVIPEDATYESGLIAQEVSNNAIELRHLVRGEEYDASGNPQTLSVNYTGLHAYEVGAIKELLERVKYLEQEVERLKTINDNQ